MKALVIFRVSSPDLRRKIQGKVKNYGSACMPGLYECEPDEKELRDLRDFFSKLPLKSGEWIKIYTLCATCDKKSLSFGHSPEFLGQPEWVIF